MIRPRDVLLDIEGTTSSIAYVKDTLFPYSRRELPTFVQEHRDDPEARRWLDAVAAELGGASDEQVVAALLGWIAEDRKHTALKALQGLIWEEGYARGAFRTHLYPDVAPALKAWHNAGNRLYVYSSGSARAQRLLFAHTAAGDLAPLLSGYFDTEIGGKRDPASYARITEDLGRFPNEILFLSDAVAELDAARAAGLVTTLLDRRADYPQPRLGDAANGHRRAESFAEIDPEEEPHSSEAT